MALRARRPRSKAWLIAAGAAIAISLLLVAVEQYAGWPDALRIERTPRLPPMR